MAGGDRAGTHPSEPKLWRKPFPRPPLFASAPTSPPSLLQPFLWPFPGFTSPLTKTASHPPALRYFAFLKPPSAIPGDSSFPPSPSPTNHLSRRSPPHPLLAHRIPPTLPPPSSAPLPSRSRTPNPRFVMNEREMHSCQSSEHLRQQLRCSEHLDG